MYSTERKNEFLQRLISRPKEHSLPNLDIKCLEHGWGEMEYNHGIDSETMFLYGKECSHGIGIHVPGTIEIKLDGNYDNFSGFAGQENNHFTAVNRKYFTYEIIADGKSIWNTGKSEDDYHAFDLDVKGVKVLVLKVYSPALDNSFGHIFWGDLKLESSEKVIEIGRHISKEKPVFSFDYDGVCSDSFLADWDYDCEKGKSKEGDTYKVTYKDPQTKLQVVLDVIDYEKDSAIWWDYSFKNLSGENSKQISNIRTLSANIFGMNKPVLRSAKGSDCKIDDFRPISFDMKLNEPCVLSTNGGRSTNGDIPYFNLSCDNKSIVGALGWSGQWISNFVKISDDTVSCSMGITADTYLYPGEEIKVPSMCLVFSDGEFEEAQNDFRKFLVDYIIPRDEKGEIIPAPVCVMGWGGMTTDEYEKRIDAIDKYKLPYEYYWVDAGWYGPEDSYSPDEHRGDWAIHVGDWEVNPKAHPKGLRYLSDRFGEIGLKFLLWIEIERAISDTPVVLEHPEFWLGVRSKNSNLILNIADDKACDWVIDYVSDMIEKYNIKCFREDYNFDPLAFWTAKDEEGRFGMTEIKAVNNGYRFWKTLLERFPGLIIDNCASGGRRLDINMAKLSFSLWRTDYQCFFDYDPMGPQLVQNWTSPWMINTCAGTQEFPLDTFRMRACYGTGYCMHFCSYEARPVKDDYPYDWHRKMLEDYKRVRPYFYGNYYSLIDAKLDYTSWISYEYFREDLGEGCVFVFREKESSFRSADLRLKGLDKNAVYTAHDLDDNSVFEMSGCDLMEKGLSVAIPNKYESRLYIIKKIK